MHYFLLFSALLKHSETLRVINGLHQTLLKLLFVTVFRQ